MIHVELLELAEMSAPAEDARTEQTKIAQSVAGITVRAVRRVIERLP